MDLLTFHIIISTPACVRYPLQTHQNLLTSAMTAGLIQLTDATRMMYSFVAEHYVTPCHDQAVGPWDALKALAQYQVDIHIKRTHSAAKPA